jgi:hypothetical protein
MTTTYTTRISLYRGAILEQMMELDLNNVSRLRASRLIRYSVAFLLKMSSHAGEGISIRVGPAENW